MNKFYKWGFVFYFVLFFKTNSHAQLSPADSTLFSTIFTSQIYIPYWNYPYPWYVYDSIQTKQQLENRFITTFPFTPADFNNNTYENIQNATLSYSTQVNSSFNTFPWIYNQTDPVMQLPFTLNGKMDTAYTAYTPSVANGDCNTAFLLIHGNDINTTTQLLQGIGYACYYCNVKNTCLQYGDVYTYSKPNEDWRAIYWKRKKLNDYAYNYCEAIGHNYGTNYLIETMALVKHLKKSYSKIILLGISEGGYTALLNLLNTEPDAAVVSGGYSIDFDTYLPSQFLLSNRFGNAPDSYRRDTVKDRISKSKTNILFTWGESDNVDLMDPEHDFHFTQNFLNNTTNCSYFYNFNYHTFPPCGVLDTFIQRIKAKPKAFIVPITGVCKSDSQQIKIGLCGQAPFQFSIYKNDTLLTSINTNNDTVIYTLMDEGSYQIKNMDDASIHAGYSSNVYSFTKDASVGFSISNKQFICDSNFTSISIQLAGTAPWTVSSTIDNVAVEDTFYTSTPTKHYNNTELIYLQVTDSNHCSLNINQAISIHDSLIDVVLSAPQYDCDSNKTAIQFNLSGRKPWLIQYKKNGIPLSFMLHEPMANQYFDNGFYEFLSITDSNQCQKNINQLFNINHDSLHFVMNTPAYHCDSNKTAIQMTMQGNAPFTIDYTKDGNPFQLITNNNTLTPFFENGNYVFQQITDATGCVKNINESFSFNFNPVDALLSTPTYDCDSNKTLIHVDLQGNAPWTIQYSVNGIPQQLSTNTVSNDYYFANGLYQFIHVTDATCTHSINQNFFFNKDSIGIQLSTPIYHCDSNKTAILMTMQGNAPFTIDYTKDGNPLQLTTNNYSLTPFFENGNYVFQQITDATGCVKNINESFVFNFNPVSALLSTPIYDCDSNKTLIHLDLQGNAPWTIQFTQNGSPMQLVTYNNSFDDYVNNGMYQFIHVSDSTNCFSSLNQSFSFNYNMIDVQLSAPADNCDSNKTLIQFDIQGNPPFIVHYTKDGQPQQLITSNATSAQYFANGNYVFEYVIDSTGCIKNINLPFTFSFDAVNYAFTTPQYNCDSNKTYIHIDLQGDSPWTIQYLENGSPSQLIANTNSVDLYLNNGIYQFIQVSDISCTKLMTENFVFNYNSINATIASPIYHCDSNKTAIAFTLQGNAPFTIDYTKDGLPLQFNTSNNNFTAFVDNGNYVFQQLTDATGCVKNINQTYLFNYQAIAHTLSTPAYNCDSNKTLIHIDLQGNAPFTINYTENGLAQQFITNANSNDFYYNNGLYQFIQVTDATNCTSNINQNFVFNYNSINATLATPMYHCDSNKTAIAFTLQGNAPFTIDYTKDGLPLQFNTSNNNFTAFVDNGNYVIQQLTDATGCVKNINQTYLFNYQAIAHTLSTPLYNCDSNKTLIHIDLQGNAPFTINYTENGLAQQFITNANSNDFYFNNGLYQFIQVSDATNCTSNINQNFVFNYNSINATLATPMYHCDSNKTAIAFTLQGNAPFTINYTKDGMPLQFNTSNNNFTAFVDNGNYVFQQLTDATGCVKNINQTYLFNYQAIAHTLSTPVYNCDSNKTLIHIDLQGNAPFTINYTENGLAQQFITNANSNDFYFNNGLYQFIQVSDATNCTSNINQNFVFNYNSINATLATPFYHCDSNKTAIAFTLQGNAPFTIDYTKDGMPLQFNTSNNNFTVFVDNGNYVIQQLTDATGCVKNINQTYLFNYQAIAHTLSTPVYNCDSNKTLIHIDLQGNAPFTINYTENGLAQQLITNANSNDFYFNNGLYQFIQVSDATNCTSNINQNFVFNYNSINATLATPFYHCDSNKTAIAFTLQGNAPFTIDYTKDGMPLQFNTSNNNFTVFVDNGNYVIQQLTDATGCVKNINQTYLFNYQAIAHTLSTPVYNCDSNKTLIHIDLQGNAPFTINYTENGLAQQLITNANSNDFYFNNGLYQFIQVSDATNCTSNINQNFVFNYNSINATLATPMYHCDSNKTAIAFTLQGNAPFTINYTKDGLPLQFNTSNNNFTAFVDNGNYVFQQLTDATGCVKNINQTYLFNYQAIAHTLSTPVYNCDSNKTLIHIDLQGNAPFTINYTVNGLPQQLNTNANSNNFYFNNGLYQFIQVSDATNCTSNINQTYLFNYQAINATINQQKYHCDSNKYEINMALQGNGPWTIFYNNGVQYFSTTTFQAALKLYLNNGNWTITKVRDITNCEYVLNQNILVNYQALNVITTTPNYDCDSNKVKVNFTLTGNAPWTIHYTTQNIPPVNYSIQTNNPNYKHYFSNGNYLITQVMDSTLCMETINQTVINNFTPLTYTKSPNVYNCDSNKMLIQYAFTGDAPYKLSYKNNATGIITQLNSVLPYAHFYLGNGIFTILNVQDAKCTKIINDTIKINYQSLISNVSDGVVSCDSNKVFVQFSTPQGNPPFTYHYTFNNQAFSFTTSNNNSTLYLNNGTYLFDHVTDSMGCVYTYNKTVQAAYHPFSLNGFSKQYLCDKDSTAITFDVTNQSNVSIVYTFNGGSVDSFIIAPNGNKTFTVTNGNYSLLYIRDTAGCIHNINQDIQINYAPVTVNYDATRHCDTRSYEMHFNLTGTAPWQLSYVYNNKPYTEILHNTPFVWVIEAGTYYLESIKDSNNCVLEINKTETLPYFLSDFPTLYYKDNHLYTIQTAYQYLWYKDEVLIDDVSKQQIPVYGNGVYQVLIIDSLGCNNWSNKITLDYPSNINVFPNPVSSVTNIVVNDIYGNFWTYAIVDLKGFVIESGEVNTPSKTIDMKNYAQGVYSLMIHYENQSPKQKSVIRLLKQ